jgi:hypothetical protein
VQSAQTGLSSRAPRIACYLDGFSTVQVSFLLAQEQAADRYSAMASAFH